MLSVDEAAVPPDGKDRSCSKYQEVFKQSDCVCNQIDAYSRRLLSPHASPLSFNVVVVED